MLTWIQLVLAFAAGVAATSAVAVGLWRRRTITASTTSGTTATLRVTPKASAQLVAQAVADGAPWCILRDGQPLQDPFPSRGAAERMWGKVRAGSIAGAFELRCGNAVADSFTRRAQ